MSTNDDSRLFCPTIFTITTFNFVTRYSVLDRLLHALYFHLVFALYFFFYVILLSFCYRLLSFGSDKTMINQTWNEKKNGQTNELHLVRSFVFILLLSFCPLLNRVEYMSRLGHFEIKKSNVQCYDVLYEISAARAHIIAMKNNKTEWIKTTFVTYSLIFPIFVPLETEQRDRERKKN